MLYFNRWLKRERGGGRRRRRRRGERTTTLTRHQERKYSYGITHFKDIMSVLIIIIDCKWG